MSLFDAFNQMFGKKTNVNEVKKMINQYVFYSQPSEKKEGVRITEKKICFNKENKELYFYECYENGTYKKSSFNYVERLLFNLLTLFELFHPLRRLLFLSVVRSKKRTDINQEQPIRLTSSDYMYVDVYEYSPLDVHEYFDCISVTVDISHRTKFNEFCNKNKILLFNYLR